MRILLAWLPAVVLAAAIFLLSAQPDLKVAEGVLDLVLRKLGHFAIFGLLAAACLRGLAAHGVTGPRALVAALALTTAYAASDEFHQRFTPGRSPALRDVAIDVAGALAVLALLAARPRLRDRILAAG